MRRALALIVLTVAVSAAAVGCTLGEAGAWLAPRSYPVPVYLDPGTGAFTPTPPSPTARPVGTVPGGGGAALVAGFLPEPWRSIVTVGGGALGTLLVGGGAYRKREALVRLGVRALAQSPEARKLMKTGARAAGLSPLLESYVARMGIENRGVAPAAGDVSPGDRGDASRLEERREEEPS